MYTDNFSILSFLSTYLFLFIAIAIFYIICHWKLFEKASQPGWAAIVPFYNLYILYKITWGNGWFFLINFLGIIPVAGSIAVLVINIITLIKLSKAFGKSDGYAVGLILLGFIFLPMLALGNSQYTGVPGKSDTNANNFNQNQDIPGNQKNFCPFCGNEIEKDANFCVKCGKKIR